MVSAEEKRAKGLAAQEKRKAMSARERQRIMDQLVGDLPNFGINLTVEEIEAWFEYAKKSLSVIIGPNGPAYRVERVRPNGWVLLIAVLYRQDPQWDPSREPFRIREWGEAPDPSSEGPIISRSYHSGSALAIALMSAMQEMQASVMVDGAGGPIYESNVAEAFPTLGSFTALDHDLAVRFDLEFDYAVDGEDASMILDHLVTVERLSAKLRKDSWRPEVDEMWEELSVSIGKLRKALKGMEAPTSDDPGKLLVPGFQMAILDDFLSFRGGHFSYLMTLLGLMRAQEMKVSKLTADVVNGFASVSRLLDGYVQ